MSLSFGMHARTHARTRAAQVLLLLLLLAWPRPSAAAQQVPLTPLTDRSMRCMMEATVLLP